MPDFKKTPLEMNLEVLLGSMTPETRAVIEIVIAHQNANHSNIMCEMSKLDEKIDRMDAKIDPVVALYNNMGFTGRLVLRVLAWGLGTVITIGGAYQVLKGWFNQ